MGVMNDDQFWRRNYKGRPGEPNPDEYGKVEDWESDHGRYTRRLEAGETYHDSAESVVKKKRQEDETKAREEFKPVAKERTVKRNNVAKNMKAVSRGLTALGMPTKRKKNWF
jgi:hypothetical protein